MLYAQLDVIKACIQILKKISSALPGRKYLVYKPNQRVPLILRWIFTTWLAFVVQTLVKHFCLWCYGGGT